MTPVVSKPDKAVRFAVRLTPKGGRDAIEGWQSDAAGRRILKARVSEPAEDGKANAALIELLAKALGLAKSKVTIVSGAAARRKTIAVESGDVQAILDRLERAGEG